MNNISAVSEESSGGLPWLDGVTCGTSLVLVGSPDGVLVFEFGIWDCLSPGDKVDRSIGTLCSYFV